MRVCISSLIDYYAVVIHGVAACCLDSVINSRGAGVGWWGLRVNLLKCNTMQGCLVGVLLLPHLSRPSPSLALHLSLLSRFRSLFISLPLPLFLSLPSHLSLLFPLSLPLISLLFPHSRPLVSLLFPISSLIFIFHLFNVDPIWWFRVISCWPIYSVTCITMHRDCLSLPVRLTGIPPITLHRGQVTVSLVREVARVPPITLYPGQVYSLAHFCECNWLPLLLSHDRHTCILMAVNPLRNILCTHV